MITMANLFSNSMRSTSLCRVLTSAPFSTAAGSEWSQAFFNATSSLRSDVSFVESANRLRELTKTNLLKATDLRDAPERFFEAHRILARHSVEHGPGFWIRFTVHYNLCAGTILAG